MSPELRELLSAAIDPDKCEATAYPWWFIFDPALIHAKAMSTQAAAHFGCYAVTGPFFSREEADATLKRYAHRFSKHALVYCASGHMSEDYKALLAMARYAFTEKS